jgi:hypothetical protein
MNMVQMVKRLMLFGETVVVCENHTTPPPVPPKRQLACSGLHGVMSQKIELFKIFVFWDVEV